MDGWICQCVTACAAMNMVSIHIYMSPGPALHAAEWRPASICTYRIGRSISQARRACVSAHIYGCLHERGSACCDRSGLIHALIAREQHKVSPSDHILARARDNTWSAVSLFVCMSRADQFQRLRRAAYASAEYLILVSSYARRSQECIACDQRHIYSRHIFISAFIQIELRNLNNITARWMHIHAFATHMDVMFSPFDPSHWSRSGSDSVHAACKANYATCTEGRSCSSSKCTASWMRTATACAYVRRTTISRRAGGQRCWHEWTNKTSCHEWMNEQYKQSITHTCMHRLSRSYAQR